MKNFKARPWLLIALINFFVVALAGLTMRYKNIYSLAAIDQKNLMHGHSHFAFTSWIAMALMVFMVQLLQNAELKTSYAKYNCLLLINLLCSYGMLTSFTLQGYALCSIILSTSSILISFCFIYYYLRDLKRLTYYTLSPQWLKAALALWAFSALGAFTLAFLMATHNSNQDLYFMGIYLFLHFQYNGWFLFAAIGIFLAFIEKQLPRPWQQFASTANKLFWIMLVTVAPAYLLSIVWMKLPRPFIWIADLTAVAQLLIIALFIRLLYLISKNKQLSLISPTTRWLWRLAASAFILKVFLQAGSVIPLFNVFAFSVRGIVIGYLHLCFIGMLSLFILGQIHQGLKGSPSRLKIHTVALVIFITGFLLQEIMLMIQGIGVMEAVVIKSAGQLLLFAALLMAVGLLVIVISGCRQNKKDISSVL